MKADFDHKIWVALPIIVRVMYRIGCLFDKSDHLFVDLPATRAISSGIQTDLCCMPQIRKALCLNIFIPGIFKVLIKVTVIHF